mgnify:CR=1 FL=1
MYNAYIKSIGGIKHVQSNQRRTETEILQYWRFDNGCREWDAKTMG